MNKSVATLLLQGQYICQFRYPNEFEILQQFEVRESVDAWLGGIGKRLACLGEDGAYFMAPLLIHTEDVRQLKTEFQNFRDVYGPAIEMLDLIRQTDVMKINLIPGEYIHLYALEQAVANSTTLEMQLKSRLDVIDRASQTYTVRENLRRLVEHLCKDGYLVRPVKDQDTYRVTGKVDQLYAVLEYLSTNVALPEVDGNEAAEVDLIQASQNAEGAQ